MTIPPMRFKMDDNLPTANIEFTLDSAYIPKIIKHQITSVTEVEKKADAGDIFYIEEENSKRYAFEIKAVVMHSLRMASSVYYRVEGFNNPEMMQQYLIRNHEWMSMDTPVFVHTFRECTCSSCQRDCENNPKVGHCCKNWKKQPSHFEGGLQ